MISTDNKICHRSKTALALLLLALFHFCGGDRTVLLKINTHTIPVSNFYQIVPVEDLAMYSPDELKKMVNDYAFDELMLYDAKKIKIHNDKALIDQFISYKKNLLIESYLQKVIVDSIISEKSLLHAYASLSSQFRDAHPYSKYRQRLFESAISKNRTALQNGLTDLMEKTEKKHMLRFDDSVLVSLSSQYNEIFRQLYSQNGGGFLPLDVLIKINDNPIVVRSKSRSYSKSWLQNEVERRRVDLPFGTISPDLLRNIFKTLIIEDIFCKMAYKNKLNKTPIFLNSFNNYKNRVILSHYKALKIYNTIVANEDTLYNYYLKNSGTRYLSPQKTEVCEIFIRDSLRAVEILKRVRSGTDFYSQAKKYTERFQDQKRPGYLGFITDGQYGGIGKAAQLLKAGEVCGRLIPSGGGFSIIKSLSYLPPEPTDFTTVKSVVSQDFSEERYYMIRDSLISQLKEKYRLRIYFENLNFN